MWEIVQICGFMWEVYDEFNINYALSEITKIGEKEKNLP